MSNEKKQLIFIMVDTQSADMLGCYGNKHLSTPNIDSLANDGLVYDKAYTCITRSNIYEKTFRYYNYGRLWH